MRRLLLAAAVVSLCVAAGTAGRLGRAHRAEAREFREAHAADRIVGRTADQIVAAHGEPYSVQRGPDGSPELILYKQVTHGQYCAIALRDGVAVGVSFPFQ